MVWTSLGERLGSLPLVLAGPMLRKVTNRSVTVWVVTKHKCKVRLKVLGNPGWAPAERPTVQLGLHLHMVAVTFEVPIPYALAEGIIHRYDMEFQIEGPGASWKSLSEATTPGLLGATPAQLAYGSHMTPTFCLPPSDLTKLRIVHGSCRKPHGEGGSDALVLLHRLIEESASDAFGRPHQLVLTGDQIYADDVAAGLLTMITDAADVLLGHGDNSEQMPLPPSIGSPTETNPLPGSRGWAFAKEMAPYQRNFALYQSGLSSADMPCHLMTLGEYLVMYLFVWSDVLWPVGNAGPYDLQLPSVESIVTNMSLYENFMPHPMAELQPTPKAAHTYKVKGTSKRRSVMADIEKHNGRLQKFHRTLKHVRRVLANVPTYMIFDDHEITDDWNMRLDATIKIHELAPGRPGTGRRVVQNGLVAYALCQHWGNCPEQFADDGTSPAGKKLLGYLDGVNGTEYVTRSLDICGRIGLPTGADITREERMFHPPDSLIYNYTIEGTAHQIVVTDTRTWREFPHGDKGHTVLLSEQQLRAQLSEAPSLEGRQSLVVLSTNAPPIPSIRTAEKKPRTSEFVKFHPDLYEAWVLGTREFDQLFKVLSGRLPEFGGRRIGSVVLLSGDVHHSFATRIHMSAVARLGDPPGQGQEVSAVFAQLVSSSLRNEDDDTRAIGQEGYAFSPGAKGVLIPKERKETLYGWNIVPAGVPKWVAVDRQLGLRNRDVSEKDKPIKLSKSGTVGGRFAAGGVFRQLILGSPDFKFKVSPDWMYQVEYMRSPAIGADLPHPPMPQFGPVNRLGAASQKVLFMKFYERVSREGDREKECVGVNNISEITFDGPDTDRIVRHTIRWLDKAADLKFASFPIALKPPPFPLPLPILPAVP
jgi:hypothetical protein